MMKNILNNNIFSFYKDPNLTMKISSSNLYDQIDKDGWVDLYFGGKGIFIPEIGEFNSYVFCNTTFFWDIVDGFDRRTKKGVEQLFVSKNKNMVPWYGDLIPDKPSEVFDYYDNNSCTNKDETLICSNLWFYNSLFLDEYYRYNLIILPKDKVWPDEQNALIIPMNDKMHIPKDYYIVGYRPKPEYLYQLAVMPMIKSGKEYAIHFKIKLDTNYIVSNPNHKLQLKIFSTSGDSPRFMLYPENPIDLVWNDFNTEYLPEYKTYIFKNFIQINLPNKNDLNNIKKKRGYLLKYSNIIIKLDSFNFKNMVDNIFDFENKKINKLYGVAKYVYRAYKIWESWYKKDVNKPTINNILNYILFNKRPWNGFLKLYNAIHKTNDKFVYKNNVKQEGYKKKIYIKEINGIKQFYDGYIPDNALGYLNPPDNYYYAGNVGNGMYLIMINGEPKPVYCDMDNGGWMLLVDGCKTGTEYIRNIFNNIPDMFTVDERGIAFDGYSNGIVVDTKIRYSSVKIAFVDDGAGCGFDKVEIYGDKTKFLYCDQGFTDECKSILILGDSVKYDGSQQEIADFYKIDTNKINEFLYIKYTTLNDYNKTIKYIKFLWAK